MSVIKADLAVAPQDLYTSSVIQGTDLGARATTGDGRIFRYCLAGGTSLVAGKLQQSTAEDTTNWENLTAVAASIGATTISTSSSTTNAANVFANGLALISVTPGAGYSYGIAANTATAAATGLSITLSDPLQVALTTTSRIDLIPNPYSNVIVNPATASGVPVGVATYIITNAQYGWIQTHGATNVLADGTVTVGTTLVASNAVAGAVEPFAGVQQVVGIAITGIATTEYGAVFLTLD